jgi:hypothetical protein
MDGELQLRNFMLHAFTTSVQILVTRILVTTILILSYIIEHREFGSVGATGTAVSFFSKDLSTSRASI